MKAPTVILAAAACLFLAVPASAGERVALTQSSPQLTADSGGKGVTDVSSAKKKKKPAARKSWGG